MDPAAPRATGVPSERSRLYKNKDKDGEELRRRRNDASVELRKASKTEQMMKRRNIDAGHDDDEDLQLGGGLPNQQQLGGQQAAGASSVSPLRESNQQFASATVDEICKAMRAGSPADRFAAIQACRRALSKERHPPIDDFVSRGVIPELVAALGRGANHQIVFEAAWALTNIASGDAKHTLSVVESGALPPLIDLLRSDHLNVAEQAVWALGNIAGDGSELRDRAIKAGVVQPLLFLLQRIARESASGAGDANASLLGNCAWLVSNLCRNKNPPPPASAVLELLPAMAALLQAAHKEVVQDTCWALSYVTDAANDLIGQVHTCYDSDGRNVFHHCAAEGRSISLRVILLRLGPAAADSAATAFGVPDGVERQTPIHYMAARGALDMLRAVDAYLQLSAVSAGRAGDLLNRRWPPGGGGRTPYELAEAAGARDTCQWLWERGAAATAREDDEAEEDVKSDEDDDAEEPEHVTKTEADAAADDIERLSVVGRLSDSARRRLLDGLSRGGEDCGRRFAMALASRWPSLRAQSGGGGGFLGLSADPAALCVSLVIAGSSGGGNPPVLTVLAAALREVGREDLLPELGSDD